VQPAADLTITNLPAAHWLPLERKAELIEAICTSIKSEYF